MNDDEADAERRRRLNELRRTAYSRTTTPAERESAAEAQRLLAELERRDRVVRPAAVAATAIPAAPPSPALSATSADPGGSAFSVEAADQEAAPPAPRLRRTLVIAAALALVIGLGAGFGAGVLSTTATQASAAREAAANEPTDGAAQQALSDQFLANDRASEIPYVGAGKTAQIYGPGDSEAAERWFADPQRPEDVPDSAPIEGADMSTLRLVYNNAEWGRVWVAKGTDGTLCLYTQDGSDIGGGLACTDPESFDANGLGWQLTKAGGSSSITLRWDGWDLLVAMNSY